LIPKERLEYSLQVSFLLARHQIVGVAEAAQFRFLTAVIQASDRYWRLMSGFPPGFALAVGINVHSVKLSRVSQQSLKYSNIVIVKSLRPAD
jgi:hypothetical protein